jgi:hypothetical protein
MKDPKKGSKIKLIESPGTLCLMEPVDDENAIKELKKVRNFCLTKNMTC